jgi:transposase
MKAYPLEFRERIVAAVDDGTQTVAEVAALFGVGERYVYKLLARRRLTGSLAPLAHGGGATAKLTESHLLRLVDLVAADPDATLAELQQRLRRRARVTVSLSTLWRALEQLDLTRKKSRGAARKPTR